MSIPFEALTAEVLGLPAADRARLLDPVVASLDAEACWDYAWDELSVQLLQDLEQGQVKEVPAAEVIERLRARVG